MKYEVFWKNPRYEDHPSLNSDITADILIVGGGVTGVSLAYFLALGGAKNIVLIEKDRIASGATGRAAGNFVHGMESGEYWSFINRYGAANTKIYWDAQIRMVEKVQTIISKENIDCDFNLGRYYVLGRKKDESIIRKEIAVRKKFRDEVELLDKTNIANETGVTFFDVGERLRKIPLVNPLKFTQNLSTTLSRHGVRVHEKTPLISVRGNVACTPRSKIRFGAIVYAVDSSSRSVSTVAVKTSIVVTEPLSRRERNELDVKRPFAFEDCIGPSYNYGKLLLDGRILVGGGDVLMRSETKRFSVHYLHIRYLKGYLEKIFPALHLKIEYAWSGTFGAPKGLMPLVSIQKSRYMIAGGGTQICSMAIAEFIAHKILGNPHPLSQVFAE